MQPDRIQPTQSLSRTASWVIVDKETGKAVMETFEESTAKKVNQARYEVVPILEYLQTLNRRLKSVAGK